MCFATHLFFKSCCITNIVYIYDVGEEFLDVEKPEFEACRRQLRSGPASSLRVNIRAVSLKLIWCHSQSCFSFCLMIKNVYSKLSQVAQYASDDGFSKTATDDVDRCLRYRCFSVLFKFTERMMTLCV